MVDPEALRKLCDEATAGPGEYQDFIAAARTELPKLLDTLEAVEKALTSERLPRAFHEAYEALAPQFGYETREASAVAWEDVPVPNKNLMEATCKKVTDPILAILEGGER